MWFLLIWKTMLSENTAVEVPSQHCWSVGCDCSNPCGQLVSTQEVSGNSGRNVGMLGQFLHTLPSGFLLDFVHGYNHSRQLHFLPGNTHIRNVPGSHPRALGLLNTFFTQNSTISIHSVLLFLSGQLLFPFSPVLNRALHRPLLKMVTAMVPVMTGTELQPSESSHTLLFLDDLPGSIHTQDCVPKLGQQDKSGGWFHMQV